MILMDQSCDISYLEGMDIHLSQWFSCSLGHQEFWSCWSELFQSRLWGCLQLECKHSWHVLRLGYWLVPLKLLDLTEISLWWFHDIPCIVRLCEIILNRYPMIPNKATLLSSFGFEKAVAATKGDFQIQWLPLDSSNLSGAPRELYSKSLQDSPMLAGCLFLFIQGAGYGEDLWGWDGDYPLVI